MRQASRASAQRVARCRCAERAPAEERSDETEERSDVRQASRASAQRASQARQGATMHQGRVTTLIYFLLITIYITHTLAAPGVR